MKLKAILFLGVAMMSVAAAHAQVDSTPVQAADDTGQITDIIVTAQKRSEVSQKVPITLTVLSSQQIASTSVGSSMDLSRVVPGLVMNKSLGNSLVYLRGVGQPSGIVGGSESPVAVYVDGVYLSSPAAGIFSLNNVDQIAVLKGPQGTLFGRNTTGGVIQVMTRDPGPDTEVEIEAGYGNYETYTSRVRANVPVSDTVSTVLAGSVKRRDKGYVRNVTTGNDILDETSYTVQNKWLIEPADGTRLTANLVYDRYDGGEGASYQVAKGYLSPDQVTTYLGPRKVATRIDGTNKSHLFIGSLKGEHEFEWATLTAIAARTALKSSVRFSQTGTPGRPNPGNFPAVILTTPADVKTSTGELQLQAPAGGRFQWILGGFFMRDRNEYSLISFQDETFASSIHSIIKTTSYAVYGQGTYPLIADIRLTAGLRYTYDHKKIDGETHTGASPSPLLPNKKSWRKLTWRLSLDKDLASNLMAFASYNRGFKAGLYNSTSFANPPVNPEVLDAYEAGFKSSLFGNRLRLNLTGFYYDYKDIQLRTSIQTPVVGLFTYNAAKARTKGIDAEIIAVVAKNLKLNFGSEYLHARYTDFRAGQFPAVNPVTTIPSNCRPRPPVATIGGVTPLTCDLSGKTLQRAPSFVATFGVEYGFDVPVGRVTINLNDNYNSGYSFDPDNTLKQRGYHYVTANVRLTAPDEKWTVKLWGTNLANEVIYGGGGFASTFYTLPSPPVMYGASVSFKL